MSIGKPKQGLAITSLVLGLLSLVCLPVLVGVVLGPPAVITGHLARSRARKSPERYGGARMALWGLITGYVGTALVLGIVIAVAVTVPRVQKMQEDFGSERCLNNLKQVALAARVYSEANKYRFPDSFLQMTNELGSAYLLVCPADPGRAGRSGRHGWNETNITYEFVEPGIQETPETTDKVVFRCPVHGHVALVDGSVQAGTLKPRTGTDAQP